MPPTEKNDILSSKRDATNVVGMQPKLSLKDVAKKPIKDSSKPKTEDTELIKLIKESQIKPKPRGPKQPYELASGAVTPTASPIDAAVLAASGMPQLIGRGLLQALPYLDAPLTVGSKVFPSVTANNVLRAAGAAYSGEQIINPESDLRTNPNAENILMTGLGLVGLPYKSAGLSFIDDLGQAGKYLTTKTPIKDTWKLLPEGTFQDYSKLRTPDKSYRVAGMDAYEDFVSSGKLRSRTPMPTPGMSFAEKMQQRPTAFPSFQKGYADLNYLPEEGGVVFETSLPTFKRGELNPVTGLQIKGRHYAHRVIDPETGAILGNVPAKDVNVYESTPNWLKGYPQIKVPKPTTASSSVDDVGKSFKSEIDWAKWNKEIPENKALMQEYNAIEQQAKANGTWMKNPDGSAFQGTPEQFVQQNSENFKKAFPNGPSFTFRGGKNNNTFRGSLNSSNNPEIGSVFTADKNSAKYYGSDKRIITPNDNNVNNGEPGIMELLYNKSNNSLEFPANFSKWDNIDRSLLPSPHNVNIKNISHTENPKVVTTDDLARYTQDKNLDYTLINNINDGIPMSEEIIFNHKPGNYLKSKWYNNGMFDMTNPNIYKSLFPYIGLGGAGTLVAKGLQENNQEHKYGGNMKLNKYNYGGYMYGNGGNTLYVNDPNHPRLKAYQDSLNVYNLSQQAEKLFKKDVNNPDIYNIMDKIKTKSNPVKVITPSGEFNWSKSWDENQRRLMEEPYLVSFAKPVQPVKYQKLDKIKTTDKLIDNTYNNFIDLITRPTEKVNTPKIFTDEYTSNYNNPNINKGRIKYGKGKTEEFAYGGYMNKHLYANGGTSILNQSNLGSVGTDFKVNNNPVLTTPELSYKPDNKSPFATESPMQTGGKGMLTDNLEIPETPKSNAFSGNYAGMATAAISGIGKTIADVKNAETENDKVQAGIEGGLNTTLDVVGTAIPIVGAVSTIGKTVSGITEATNPTVTYKGKSGKNYSYQSGKYGDTAAAWNAVGNPAGNVSNAIGSFAGTKENYGMNDFAMGVADLFVPFLSEGVRNKKAREAYYRDSTNVLDSGESSRNLTINSPEMNIGKYGGKMYSWGGNIYANGGPITFSSGGEKHKVYIKESPNGLGKGVKGHVMVNHPTMNKGKWDTIDLTEKAGAKTVAQGVAATKKWHRENPSYAMGGHINTMYAGGGSMYNMPTKGLTHEQHPWGGYPIGGNNYVEGGEVILDKPDGGKYIFSNRLSYK